MMNGSSMEAQSFACEKFLLAWRGDQFAQEWFQRHFRGILLDWLNRHPGREAACRLYSEEYYVDRTFRDAWHRALDCPQVEFNTLPAVIQYLVAHFNGLIMDALRTLKLSEESHLMPSGLTQEKCIEDRTEAQELWESIQERLSSERERRLAYLLFHCSFKPEDIMQTFSQEFSDAREISHVRHSVMELIGNTYA
jgi:hypothetical protein